MRYRVVLFAQSMCAMFVERYYVRSMKPKIKCLAITKISICYWFYLFNEESVRRLRGYEEADNSGVVTTISNRTENFPEIPAS